MKIITTLLKFNFLAGNYSCSLITLNDSSSQLFLDFSNANLATSENYLPGYFDKSRKPAFHGMIFKIY